MNFRRTLGISILAFSTCVANAQNIGQLKGSTYKLDNGFSVFLNEDTTANNIFGAVMVKAGALNESPDATGMAHYLEHLLFKGTKELGTSNYEKEKPKLDSIATLYDLLILETDEDSKLAIQKLINEQAIEASKYGLPNEFDKLLKSIGSTGINAFTNYDMTFYHNSFPSHEIEKWIDIYAERFKYPVFRSFQSELEVVYEEKNRAMDGLERRIFEEINKAIFPNLPYGQWSVLGKVEDLKNPSLKKMQAFYDKNYVAKNMALILTGNFKTEEVLPIIREKFGYLPAIQAPQLELPKLESLQKNKVEKIRITPLKVELLGWQTVPYSHIDRIALDVCEYILINDSETGLLDQLTVNNDLMYVFGGSTIYTHVGGFYIIAIPKPLIQSIANTDKKIENVFNRIKIGNFSDEILQASKYVLANDFQKSIEQIRSRGVAIGRAFSQGISWDEYLKYAEKVNQVTKEDVMRVANKYFGEQRAKVISRTGFPKKSKLEKPPFKAVTTNQSESSVYAKKFNKIASKPFESKFINFNNDVNRVSIFNNQQLTQVKNPVNNLFYLKIKFKTGKISNPKLSVVAELMNYSGAGSYSFTELKQAFSNIGCSYYISCSDNYFTININGSEENLSKALELVNVLIREPREDEEGLKLMYKSTKLERKREKRNKSVLGGSLYLFAKNGKDSKYLTRFPLIELKKIETADLIATYKNLTLNYKTQISYIGNTPLSNLKSTLEKEIDLSKNNKEDDFKSRGIAEITQNKIIFVHDKKAIQSQVYFYIPDNKTNLINYDKVKAFNQYFAGGISGIVFQEIREYRSLAYTAQAWYALPVKSNGYFGAYIACQADKTNEAIGVLDELIKHLPEKEDRISSLKKSLQLSAINNYPDFKSIINVISNYQLQGYQEDPNVKAYKKYKGLVMGDIMEFYEQSIKDKPRIITIYGDKGKIDINQLKKYGEVIELELKDVINF
jgi:predicted Zn-dependent peptidase